LITTTPVARWTWGRDHEESDTVGLCLRDLLAAYAVLVAHHLVVDSPLVRVNVPKAGKPRDTLFDGEFIVDSVHRPEEVSSRLAQEVQANRRAGEIGSVDATVDCTGIIGGAEQEIIQTELFLLGTHAYRDYVTTDLITFSDVWMLYDLKGRLQPSIYAVNQPRLATALQDLSVVLDSETDPEDPTYFGRPTETGIDNLFEPDGSPSDVWSRYEI
jgi:hypothetical protein